MCCVLNREDKQNKNFYLYDIFGERYSRKIKKQETKPDDSDAFDIDIDGKVLIYVSGGNELILQSLKIPDPILAHIKPRYNLAMHKENPAKIAAQRIAYV